MLAALAIANYRSLRDVVLPLAPLNIVTGPNGSGKSTFTVRCGCWPRWRRAGRWPRSRARAGLRRRCGQGLKTSRPPCGAAKCRCKARCARGDQLATGLCRRGRRCLELRHRPGPAAAQTSIGLQPRPRSQDRSDLERPRAASRRAAGRARRRRAARARWSRLGHRRPRAAAVDQHADRIRRPAGRARDADAARRRARGGFTTTFAATCRRRRARRNWAAARPC